jgi:hypothetical protein
MPDPVKANALKVLAVLRESDMDGYRLLKLAGVSEQELAEVIRRELRSIVTFQGDLSPGAIGEAYFSILPSAQGLAEQTARLLSMLP